MSPFPGADYSLIYADPPWMYKDKCAAGKRGAEFKYPCMSLDEICALPVEMVAAEDCLLAMWHVPVMPAEALRVVAAWGFRLVTFKGFTWHKRTKHGASHFGMGHWSRGNTEDCLFSTRGRPKRASASVRQFIDAPIGRHSEKPDEARRRLVQLMGDVRRIELFARAAAPGWDRWGLDAPPEVVDVDIDDLTTVDSL